MIIVMIMHMNDILMLMIVMDIIPNYNYFILFHFRGVCIHLYLMYLLFADVMWCLYSTMLLWCWYTDVNKCFVFMK